MGVRQEVIFADLHWDLIPKHINIDSIHYQPVSRYPRVRRDLALVIDQSVQYEDVQKVILKNAKARLKSINLFDVFNDENVLGKGKKSYAVSVIFQDPEKNDVRPGSG